MKKYDLVKQNGKLPWKSGVSNVARNFYEYVHYWQPVFSQGEKTGSDGKSSCFCFICVHGKFCREVFVTDRYLLKLKVTNQTHWTIQQSSKS